jgi:hypothetical protein
MASQNMELSSWGTLYSVECSITDELERILKEVVMA